MIWTLPTPWLHLLSLSPFLITLCPHCPIPISWFHQTLSFPCSTILSNLYLLVVCLPCCTATSLRAGTLPVDFFFLKDRMNSVSMLFLHKAFPVHLWWQHILTVLELYAHISFSIYHFLFHVIAIYVCVLASQINCDIRMGRILVWFIWIFPTCPTTGLCTEECW